MSNVSHIYIYVCVWNIWRDVKFLPWLTECEPCCWNLSILEMRLDGGEEEGHNKSRCCKLCDLNSWCVSHVQVCRFRNVVLRDISRRVRLSWYDESAATSLAAMGSNARKCLKEFSGTFGTTKVFRGRQRGCRLGLWWEKAARFVAARWHARERDEVSVGRLRDNCWDRPGD